MFFKCWVWILFSSCVIEEEEGFIEIVRKISGIKIIIRIIIIVINLLRFFFSI